MRRMPTHVALLRGINLGPHKRVAMPALRTLVESLGHTDVATYIASGNVVFTAAGPDAELAGDLEKAIEAELGVTCRVVALTSAELARGRRGQPVSRRAGPEARPCVLPTATGRRRGAHARRAGAGARGREGVRDEAAIVGRALYLHTPDGFGRSELAAELSKGSEAQPGRGHGPQLGDGDEAARDVRGLSPLRGPSAQ